MVEKVDSEEQNRFEEFKEQMGDLFYFVGSIVATGGTLLCALIAYAFLKPAQAIGLLGSLVIDGIESMITPTYTIIYD